ncbi:Uncharacterised protein [Bordetella pertussis]|nr:Uncharacterised protein [Bordetella pertussis]CFP66017.1 Uncharacterised protein [Bordetella pertussis]
MSTAVLSKTSCGKRSPTMEPSGRAHRPVTAT